MKSSFAAALLFVAAVSAQDIYGVYNDDLVYFGDAGSGYWTMIGKPFCTDGSLVTLIQAADVDIIGYNFYAIVADKNNNFNTELVGLSLFTGQVTYQITLPFLITRNFVNTPGVDWIPGTTDVLVYGRTGTNDDGSYNFEIIRVSPEDGTNTTVAQWTAYHEIQSVDAYDPSTGILWIQTDLDNAMWNLGWDITTGKLVYNLTDTYGLQNLNYNVVTRAIVGIGEPNQGYTPIVSLDSNTGSYTVTGQLLGEWQITGPSNAGLNAIEGSGQGMLYLYAEDSNGIKFLAIDIAAQRWTEIPFNQTYSVYPTTIAWASFESVSPARQQLKYLAAAPAPKKQL